MFEISVEEEFSAGHALREYRGKCENPHGHNYKVRVLLRGPRLNALGLLYDFKDLKTLIRVQTDRLDHQYLNDLEPFTRINPSAENLARYLFEALQKEMDGSENGVRVAEVGVFETGSTAAVYRE